MRRVLLIACVLALVVVPQAMAANVVVADSKHFNKATAACTVGVWVTNDVGITAFTLPLEVRAGGPASYPTACVFRPSSAGSPSRRLTLSPLSSSVRRVMGAPGGDPCSGPTSSTFSTDASFDAVSPDGFMWVGWSQAAPPKLYYLPAGTDSTAGEFQDWPDVDETTAYPKGPSLFFVFTTANIDGYFDVDTCCVAPANHMEGTDLNVQSVPFDFVKGHDTVGNPVPNQFPVAVCRHDVTKNTDPGVCTAAVTPAEVDSGSYDPEAGPLTFALVPPGPYAKGVTNVQLIVTDDHAQKDTCDATITVNDVTKPTITCPANIVRSNGKDTCGTKVDYAPATLSDNCPGVTSIARPPSGTVFSVGPPTTVWLVATDASGNKDSCSFTVTVNDTQKPTIACPANIVQGNDPGVCNAVVTFAPTVSDNCPGVTWVATPPSGSTFSLGVTPVKIIATDASGNKDSCSFTVEVKDTEKPVVICPANIVVPNDPGICGAVVNWNPHPGQPGSIQASDNCHVAQVGESGAASPFPVGVTTVTVWAFDDAGNTDTCRFTVTVNDTEQPVAHCHGDTTVAVPNGTPDTVVNYTTPPPTDNCPGMTTVCNPPSGARFSLGATVVTCIATDAHANKDTCTFTVTVQATTGPPVAKCKNVTVDADSTCHANASINDGSYDPDGGAVTLAQTPPGPYPLGTTHVKLLVTDDEADTASCFADVKVEDHTPPVITCPGDKDLPNNPGQCGTNYGYGYSASDNCDPNPAIVAIPPNGSFLPVGDNLIMAIATDAAGNKDTCTYHVRVHDAEAPVIECPQIDMQVKNDLGQCGAIVNYDLNSSDNCAVTSEVYSPPSGSFLPVGMTVVRCIASDAAGNKDTCFFNVYVNDVEPPVAHCPANIVRDASDLDTVSFAATASDNCPGAKIDSCVPPPGDTFAIGTTTVTCYASDAAGNLDDCQFTITIRPAAGPQLYAVPNQLAFQGTACCTPVDAKNGCVNPDPQRVTVYYGTPPSKITGMPWIALESIPWLHVDPPQGVTESFFDVFVDLAGLAPGTYHGTIYIYQALTKGFQLPDDSVVVTLNVLPGPLPRLVASVDTLYYTFDGPQSDTCQWLILTSNGCQQIDWCYIPMPGGTFVSAVVPEYGTTPSKVLVCVSPCDLNAGEYEDTLIFCPCELPEKGANVPACVAVIVKLTVVNSPTLLADPDTLIFTFRGEDTDTLCQWLSLTSTGCGEMPWCFFGFGPGSDPFMGDVKPTAGVTPSRVEVCIDPCELEEGTYEASLIFCMCDVAKKVAGPCDTVVVILNVINPPELALNKSDFEFHVTVGDDPTAQQLQILNNGGGQLIWSSRIAPCVPGDPSDWLLMNPVCGIGPTTVNLDVDYSGLVAPDTLCDTIEITAECALWSPQFVIVHFYLLPQPPQPCDSLCGWVFNTAGAPVHAWVQAWTQYPAGVLVDEVDTDRSGHFCLEVSEGTYDLRVVAEGYCPEIIYGVPCGTGDLVVHMKPIPFEPLPNWPFRADYFSENAKLFGVPLMVGDVIVATDPQGVYCGVTQITTAGQYLIHVLGDDFSTPGDEGAVFGDKITLWLNCYCPAVAPQTWANGDFDNQFDVDFDCNRRTIECGLCEGWNMMSFNIMPDDNDLQTVLTSIDPKYDRVASGTCLDNHGPRTWDRSRPPQLNDLTTMGPDYGYEIHMLEPGTLVLSGTVVPPETPIPLCQGWNAIPYLPEYPDTLAHALASIAGQYRHVFGMECGYGVRTWNADRPAILNDLICLEPCKGYWISMYVKDTLVYPTAEYNCAVLDDFVVSPKRPVNVTSRLTVTTHFADFWSVADPQITGIHEGDLITVRTPSGIIAGECVAGANGVFLVHVYGDDPQTSMVEGAYDGETMTFEVNGAAATVAEGQAVWGDRQSIHLTLNTSGASPVPAEYALLQNYPNPFNAGTVMPFVLKNASDWTLTVYNVVGQAVRSFNGHDGAGIVRVAWDGTADNATAVSSGIYFYRVTTPEWSASKKMTLLK